MRTPISIHTTFGGTLLGAALVLNSFAAPAGAQTAEPRADTNTASTSADSSDLAAIEDVLATATAELEAAYAELDRANAELETTDAILAHCDYDAGLLFFYVRGRF